MKMSDPVEEIKRLKKEKFRIEYEKLINSEQYKNAFPIEQTGWLIGLQIRYHLNLEHI